MSPRNIEQIEEIRNKSIEKIINAAMEVFAENGFGAATMTGIAKHAGVSKGLIYNYFENKDEILENIVNMMMGMFAEMMESIKKIEDPKEAISIILEMSLQMHLEQEKMFRLFSFVVMQKSVVEKYTTMFVEFYQNFVFIITKILLDLGFENPEMEARTLAAIIDGYQFHMVYVGEQLSIKDVIEFLKDKYINRG